MKNKFFLLIFAFFGIAASSQTNRFIYEYQTLRNKEYQKMYMVLDVSPKDTKFYDYKFLEYDSINKRNANLHQVSRTNSPSGQVLSRAANSFENTSYFTNNKADYFAIKSKDGIRWTLQKETKTIDGYKLHKATAEFGGRKWTAWYAPEVPVFEGPYKFRGLPGMIFQIEDSDKNFIYTLVKNKKLPSTYDTSNFVETYYGGKPLLITRAQYNKMMLDDYEDPVANLRKIIKDGGKVNMNGVDITSNTQLDQRRKGMQEEIRKYYNPIELDQAIPYPKQ